jgi:hypothetical protein
VKAAKVTSNLKVSIKVRVRAVLEIRLQYHHQEPRLQKVSTSNLVIMGTQAIAALSEVSWGMQTATNAQ